MEEIQEPGVQSLSQEDPLEKEMATHSSILAWRVPWEKKPGGLQSTGSQSDTTEHTCKASQQWLPAFSIQTWFLAITFKPISNKEYDLNVFKNRLCEILERCMSFTLTVNMCN